MFSKHNPKRPDTRFNRKPSQWLDQAGTTDEQGTHPLFPLAVFIMGIVSCYTTALGLAPMLDNLFLSYAMAFALSIFMIAIALQFPKSYINGTQNRLILGYTMVAVFSVLLNFNAIYGIFASEKLLYNELKENKKHLVALQVKAEEALDNFFDAKETERELNEAMALLDEEKTNPNDYGYGKKARLINTESVIPLQAKLKNIKTKYEPLVQEIDTTVQAALTHIDAALLSSEVKEYRKAVDISVDAYTTVGTKTTNMIADGSFNYQPLTFQHRDVGHLNHSLWSLGHIGQMDGKQVSALLVSLLLAILIDFIVLFVLVILHKPAKVEEPDEDLIDSGRPAVSDRSTFKSPRLPAPQEVEPKPNIYVKRSHRKTLQHEVPVKEEEDFQNMHTPSQFSPKQEIEGQEFSVGNGKLKMNGNHVDLN